MRSRITGTLERIDHSTNTPTATIAYGNAPPNTRNTTTLTPASAEHEHIWGGWGGAYDVLLPAYVADLLEPQRNNTVTLHTIELLEAQGQGANLIPRLIGFTHPEDRAFFNLFTTVKNLGPRKALRAMTAPPSDIAAAIAAKDPKQLKQLPGVGQRLAETIIAELAGKADRYIAPPSPDQPQANTEIKPNNNTIPITTTNTTTLPSALAKVGGAGGDALNALVRLGTPRAEAERRLTNAIANNPELNNAATTADQLLAAALAASP